MKGNVHGNFEWFGLGTSSNVNEGNVVSYNSAIVRYGEFII